LIFALKTYELFNMGSEYDKSALYSVVLFMYLAYVCGIEFLKNEEKYLGTVIIVSGIYIIACTALYWPALIWLYSRYGYEYSALGDERFVMVGMVLYAVTIMLALRNIAKAKEDREKENNKVSQ